MSFPLPYVKAKPLFPPPFSILLALLMFFLVFVLFFPKEPLFVNDTAEQTESQ